MSNIQPLMNGLIILNSYRYDDYARPSVDIDDGCVNVWFKAENMRTYDITTLKSYGWKYEDCGKWVFTVGESL